MRVRKGEIRDTSKMNKKDVRKLGYSYSVKYNRDDGCVRRPASCFTTRCVRLNCRTARDISCLTQAMPVARL